MRRLTKIACLFVVLVALRPASAPAQESLALSTPVFQQSGSTTFRVYSLLLKRSDADLGSLNNAQIIAVLREAATGAVFTSTRTLTCSYSGAAAETLLLALNTANLTTTSLERRIIARCQADGQLGAGTISGAPGH